MGGAGGGTDAPRAFRSVDSQRKIETSAEASDQRGDRGQKRPNGGTERTGAGPWDRERHRKVAADLGGGSRGNSDCELKGGVRETSSQEKPPHLGY